MAMKNEIVTAIETQKLIEFDYEGEKRIVEPHCYGITTAGHEGLRAYQVGGYSSSGKMGWKLYDMSKARNIILLDEVSNVPRSGYKKGDQVMKQIYCQI